MTPAGLLDDAYGRVLQTATAAVEGLSDDDLAHRVAPDANSIAWLVWHLARVQDAQVAPLAEVEQVWTAQGYVDRFGLDLDPDATGYGQTSEEVGRVRAPAGLLASYLQAVHEQTAAFLRSLGDDDLTRVVDESASPVTLGVRLVSILADDLQHAGQAAYLRGLLGR